jgi:hypothetical protein
MSNPAIHYNSFTDNEIAIQTRSTIYIDARHNWWGKDPPDPTMIFGDPEKNINIRPWLPAPDNRVFRADK